MRLTSFLVGVQPRGGYGYASEHSSGGTLEKIYIFETEDIREIILFLYCFHSRKKKTSAKIASITNSEIV
jgi:hypothetical protein